MIEILKIIEIILKIILDLATILGLIVLVKAYYDSKDNFEILEDVNIENRDHNELLNIYYVSDERNYTQTISLSSQVGIKGIKIRNINNKEVYFEHEFENWNINKEIYIAFDILGEFTPIYNISLLRSDCKVVSFDILDSKKNGEICMLNQNVQGNLYSFLYSLSGIRYYKKISY